ncbi:MAG: hypothetical protein HS111_32895 [Kofleriaceae bacterium]|nr:hypothetical protein [Kofleriaceae bacterium]
MLVVTGDGMGDRDGEMLGQLGARLAGDRGRVVEVVTRLVREVAAARG